MEFKIIKYQKKKRKEEVSQCTKFRNKGGKKGLWIQMVEGEKPKFRVN